MKLPIFLAAIVMLCAPCLVEAQAPKVKATATSPDSVTLAWTQSTGVPVTVPPVTCPAGSTVTNPQTITANTVYRGTTSGTETPYATITPPAATYIDLGAGNLVTPAPGLVPGQTYFYKVSASNCNGAGSLSNEATALIPNPATPAAPTGLAIQSVAQVSKNPAIYAVTLKWNAPTKYTNGQPIAGQIYYNVQRDISGTLKYSQINSSPLMCANYFDDTVAPPTSFDYTVTAWQNGKESAVSNKSGDIVP